MEIVVFLIGFIALLIFFGYKAKIKVIKYISKKASTSDRYQIKVDIVEYALAQLLQFLKEVLND